MRCEMRGNRVPLPRQLARNAYNTARIDSEGMPQTLTNMDFSFDASLLLFASLDDLASILFVLFTTFLSPPAYLGSGISLLHGVCIVPTVQPPPPERGYFFFGPKPLSTPVLCHVALPPF